MTRWKYFRSEQRRNQTRHLQVSIFIFTTGTSSALKLSSSMPMKFPLLTSLLEDMFCLGSFLTSPCCRDKNAIFSKRVLTCNLHCSISVLNSRLVITIVIFRVMTPITAVLRPRRPVHRAVVSRRVPREGVCHRVPRADLRAGPAKV